MPRFQDFAAVDVADSIAAVLRTARYDGIYGYHEMVQRAADRRMNGVAVSRAQDDAGDCYIILVDGSIGYVISGEGACVRPDTRKPDPMRTVPDFNLFDADDPAFDALIGSIGRAEENFATEGVSGRDGSSDPAGSCRIGAEEAVDLSGGIADMLNSAILRLDPEGYIVSLNRFAEEYFGYAAGELAGRHIVGTIAPEQGERGEDMRDLFTEICRKPERSSPVTYGSITREGSRVWNAWTHSPLTDECGTVTGILCIGNDVTEQILEEETLRASEEKFRLLVEYSPNMVFFNRRGRILYANEKVEAIMGYSQEELRSPDFNFFSLFSPESAEACRRTFTGQGNARELPCGEFTLLTRTGKRLEVILSARAVPFEGDEAIIGVVTDITERKREEETIRESENHYRAIFETTGTAMMIIDERGITSLANAEFEQLFGYRREEIEGEKFWKRYFVPGEHEKLRRYHRIRRKDAASAPRTYESRLIDASGAIRDLLMTVSLIPDTTSSVVSIMDITGRKQAETALRKSEERYRLLAENAKDVIWTMNMDLEFTFMSPSVRYLLGYSAEEMMAKRLDRILTPFSLQRAREVFFEERSLACVQGGKRTGGLRVMECECIRNDGSFVWIEVKVTFLTDDGGYPVAVLGVARDISERKQIERIKQDAYEQIEKNMEQFAVLNDHIRNPLQAIVGLADLEGGDLSEKIFQQAMEIDAIIKQLDIGWIESQKIREFLRKHYRQEGTVCR